MLIGARGSLCKQPRSVFHSRGNTNYKKLLFLTINGVTVSPS